MGWFATRKTTQSPSVNSSTMQKSQPANTSTTILPGRYDQYSLQSLKQAGYTTNVIFFFAAWCPECQAFKKAITGQPIPTGVQVLELDYDNATDLKKQYGVTLQSTFVKVDPTGQKLSSWVGYGKQKNLSTVLENLR